MVCRARRRPPTRRSGTGEAELFFRDPDILALELGGSNGTATARALATFYGTLAAGGERDGVHLLSPETIALFTRERIAGAERGAGGLATLRARLLARDVRAGRDVHVGSVRGAFGHDEHGGQIAFANPASRIGVGFVRSHLSMTSPLGPRLVDALYGCRRGFPQTR